MGLCECGFISREQLEIYRLSGDMKCRSLFEFDRVVGSEQRSMNLQRCWVLVINLGVILFIYLFCSNSFAPLKAFTMPSAVLL